MRARLCKWAFDVGKGRYSETFLSGIDWMLAWMPEDRPRSVAAVLPRFTSHFSCS
jgi:hypothetical protein